MVVEEEVRCPSCGRFVGAHYKCPYCGAHIKHRLSLRLFKYGSVWMAIIGVAILYLVAIKVIHVPVVKVGDITGLYNFANAKIVGKVVKVKPLRGKKGKRSFSITVDDGTGEIRITAWGDVTEDIARLDRIPRVEDEIEATGAIKIDEVYGTSLSLQSADLLTIKPAIFSSLKVKEVYPLEAGTLVNIKGGVKYKPYTKKEALNFWVEDETGKIKVYAPKWTYRDLKKFGKVPRIEDKVELSGRVYVDRKGRRSITLLRLDRFRITRAEALSPEEKVSRFNIGLITSERMGKIVECRGKVLTLKNRSNPTNIVITDNTGKIEIVYWPEVEKGVDRLVTVSGASISVKGKVTQYRGMMQVKVLHSEDITLTGERG